MEYSAAGLWSLLALFLSLPCCMTSLLNIKEMVEETCISDAFNPRCPSSHNIFITKALYGHMKLGECVTFDAGRFGCFADVTNIARQRCNGKSTCRIEASDNEIESTQPCIKGLYTYMETSYACIPNLVEPEMCTNVAASRPWKYVMLTRTDSKCMNENQAYVIMAPASMDIEIKAKIINSATFGSDSVPLTISGSHGNTTIMEVSKSSSIDTQQTFRSSAIHVVYHHPEAIMLLAFRGCEDLVAPDYTWVERKRNVIIIGCIHNEYTWQVKCIGSKWIGFRGNCTGQTESKPADETPVETENDIKPTQTIFTKGIQFAFTIGITVLLCVVVITTGFVCLRKAEYKAKASKGIELQEMTGDYSNTWKATLMRPVTNDLNNPNASPPQQFYVLNQQNDTPIETLR
ncbi:hypothetical protein CAPTEDRAFT_193927 [Capitella teleta]|uniref:SUEL-type lectin domain-containing protein n=1 Tax=Capitella teleta TaxID=283909 RepID=R7TJG7_CAPTE|nr:hypothetical protein CAPTEDRAFT_193927 [Capitella teleta]|eukprot:ELT93824.1 hypothetical protein CAPTEDRAFT_193927 [Capitella teleta]